MAAVVGERNGSAKLTEGDVTSILLTHTGARGEMVAAAERYGVSRGAIWFVVHRLHWRHVPDPRE